MTATLDAPAVPARATPPSMATMSYGALLAELALADERIVVLTAENRAAIRDLPPRLGERFIDVGIAEQTMIGLGAGLALRGRIPVMHALAAFLTMRAYEFIRTDLGVAGLPGKLVGGVAGVLSEANGPTHQAIEDVALMRTIPRMSVFCPADTRELCAALPAILAEPGPAYIRHIDRAPMLPHAPPFAIGRAHVVTHGDDVALVTYGAMLRECLDAAVLLESAGFAVHLVDMRTLAPVDERALLDAARGTRLLVTVEDHVAGGGLATIAAETLAAHGVPARLLPIHLGRSWFTPTLLPGVLRSAGLTGEQIAQRVLATIAPDRHA